MPTCFLSDASVTRRLPTALCLLFIFGPSASADIIGYWDLDETAGTVAPNRVAGGTDGTLIGGAAWVNDATRGQVIQFNGTTALIDAGMLPAFTATSDFTWAFWGNHQSADGLQVTLGNRLTNGVGEFTKFTPTRFEYGRLDAQHMNLAYSSAMPSNVWTHHAVVKDGTSFTYYRNGQVDATGTSSAALPAMPFFMGAEGGSGGFGALEHWGGMMDDVAIFDESLTQQQIDTIRSGDFSGFFQAVPEPSAALLFGLLSVSAMLRRRRRNSETGAATSCA